MNPISDPVRALGSLTAKQRDVLDLVLLHKSNKEIARDLNISVYTVDQRLSAARGKLGAYSRGDLARTYAELRNTYGDSVYANPYMAPDPALPHDQSQDLQTHEVKQDHKTTIGETASPNSFGTRPLAAPWLEALDTRFGILGRVFAIVGIAVMIAMVFLAIVGDSIHVWTNG